MDALDATFLPSKRRWSSMILSLTGPVCSLSMKICGSIPMGKASTAVERRVAWLYMPSLPSVTPSAPPVPSTRAHDVWKCRAKS